MKSFLFRDYQFHWEHVCASNSNFFVLTESTKKFNIEQRTHKKLRRAPMILSLIQIFQLSLMYLIIYSLYKAFYHLRPLKNSFLESDRTFQTKLGLSWDVNTNLYLWISKREWAERYENRFTTLGCWRGKSEDRNTHDHLQRR